MSETVRARAVAGCVGFGIFGGMLACDHHIGMGVAVSLGGMAITIYEFLILRRVREGKE